MGPKKGTALTTIILVSYVSPLTQLSSCCIQECHSPVRKRTPVNVSGPVEGGVTVEWCSGGAGRARVA